MPSLAPHPVLLYGHRGAAAERPENTIPSFERALAVGVDVLEMDVHQTADGHVVVSHDPSGARMAGVGRLIRESTLAEVQRWDAGIGFLTEQGERPFVGQGYRIPTLDEVLEHFPEAALNVDIKQITPPIAASVLGVLRRHHAERRVTVASFDAATIREVRRRGHGGPTVLARNEVVRLLALPLGLLRRFPLGGHAVQVPERYGPLRFDAPRFLERAHLLGLRVDYWTVNDALTAQRLLAKGADGLMTDDPAALRAVAARWRELRLPLRR